ncbi:MAG: DNA topoisomerase IV subunit A [Chlamydiales bacterium]
MEDIQHLFKTNYLQYASYVILDRAIPHVIDGLKPVQRRILWMLYQMDDDKFHKVANIVGQTMALHPHGDGPIVDALVNLANKGYLIETQGNFGNPLTGDPSAAPRYIEAKLSQMARETLFNPALTLFTPSYDGRTQEPTFLPAKIPLLLMQGAEGIAVGMSTKILPHNFRELIEAEISILRDKPFELYPDFHSGGIMDPSEYDEGRGKIKLRAKIISPDEKTLIIKEICYGTTTESVIRSIDEAAKRGKIKIDSINDYTAEKIEIEIKLPRNQYANQMIDQLYAFTDCEVSVNTQLISIKDQHPWEESIHEILKLYVKNLQGYLKKELEIENHRLLEKIFEKTLEQIFIHHRLYKQIENIVSYDKIDTTIEKSLRPFYTQLPRIPKEEDRDKLLSIPIRRISRFNLDKNQEELNHLEKKRFGVEKDLKNITTYTIRYLKALLEKYGNLFPRRTQIKKIQQISKREITQQIVKIGYNPDTGYIGTKVPSLEPLEINVLDKILILFKDGSYRVINIPEKQYIHPQKNPILWMGKADKQTNFCIVYRNNKTNYPYVKRFIIKQFILDKEYRFLDPDEKIEFFTTSPDMTLLLTYKSKGRNRLIKVKCVLDEIKIKGVNTKGIRLTDKELTSIKIYRNEEI